MSTIKIEDLTPEQKKQICIAYLANGNSVVDLCTQLVEKIHQLSHQPFEVFFREITSDMLESRIENPEAFETTTEEEVNTLLDLYEEHKYEANTSAWE